MQFNPYLNFDGNCAEAFAFYKDVFNGTVVHQSTFGDMPPDPDMPPLPAEAKHRVMHVHLQVGQQALMGSDAMPGAGEACAGGYVKPQGLWVSIGVADTVEGQRVVVGYDLDAQFDRVAVRLQLECHLNLGVFARR